MVVVKINLQRLLQAASQGQAQYVNGNAGFSTTISKGNGTARGRQGSIWADDEDL